eukprot:gene35798-43839_t
MVERQIATAARTAFNHTTLASLEQHAAEVRQQDAAIGQQIVTPKGAVSPTQEGTVHRCPVVHEARTELIRVWAAVSNPVIARDFLSNRFQKEPVLNKPLLFTPPPAALALSSMQYAPRRHTIA